VSKSHVDGEHYSELTDVPAVGRERGSRAMLHS